MSEILCLVFLCSFLIRKCVCAKKWGGVIPSLHLNGTLLFWREFLSKSHNVCKLLGFEIFDIVKNINLLFFFSCLCFCCQAESSFWHALCYVYDI